MHEDVGDTMRLAYRGYTAEVRRNLAANIVFGRVLDIRTVISFQAERVDQVRQAFHEAIDNYLLYCTERGIEPARQGQMTREDYLARQYPFITHADSDGGYVITFPDLPGCMTQADSLEAIAPMAEEARRLWIEVEYGRGNPIPEPFYPQTRAVTAMASQEGG